MSKTLKELKKFFPNGYIQEKEDGSFDIDFPLGNCRMNLVKLDGGSWVMRMTPPSFCVGASNLDKLLTAAKDRCKKNMKTVFNEVTGKIGYRS